MNGRHEPHIYMQCERNNMVHAEIVKTFDFEGRHYEIYVITEADRKVVQAYVEGKPANGYSYSVDFLTRMGFKHSMGYDPLADLITTAEDDVRSKTWERYCEAVRQVRTAKK